MRQLHEGVGTRLADCVPENSRRRGILWCPDAGFGKLLIDYLAAYALEQGISLLRLETGIHQPEAVGLYEKMGFQRIPPFGNYTVDPLSLCYEKQLR